MRYGDTFQGMVPTQISGPVSYANLEPGQIFYFSNDNQKTLYAALLLVNGKHSRVHHTGLTRRNEGLIHKASQGASVILVEGLAHAT